MTKAQTWLGHYRTQTSLYNVHPSDRVHGNLNRKILKKECYNEYAMKHFVDIQFTFTKLMIGLPQQCSF